MTADSLQFAPWQPRNFELFEKDRPVIWAEKAEDEAKNCTLAAAALPQNDETIHRQDFQ